MYDAKRIRSHTMTAGNRRSDWLVLTVLIVVCLGVGGLGGLVTTPNIPNWYAGLTKPSWTPPSWVFGPVWSMLYLSMAVAAYDPFADHRRSTTGLDIHLTGTHGQEMTRPILQTTSPDFTRHLLRMGLV
jgi:hypothetical protein